MVQIIDENRYQKPSFARSIVGGLAQGLPAAIEKYQSNQKQKEQISQENEAAKRMGIDLSGFSPDQRKEIMKDALQGKRQDFSTYNKFKNESDLQRQKYEYEKELEALKLKGKAPDKTTIEQQEKEQTQKTAQDAFNKMTKLLKGGNLGRGSGIGSIFGGQQAKDVGEFTSLGGALEALLVDKVNRGTLSNTRFEYITKNLLPTPHDSDATIEGKLTGLAQILGLDSSELTGKGLSDLEELTSDNAAEHKGKLVKDENGDIYRSNGKKWIKE